MREERRRRLSRKLRARAIDLDHQADHTRGLVGELKRWYAGRLMHRAWKLDPRTEPEDPEPG